MAPKDQASAALSPAMLEALQEEIEESGGLDPLREAAKRAGLDPDKVVQRYVGKVAGHDGKIAPAKQAPMKKRQNAGRKPSTERPSGFPDMPPPQYYAVAALHRLSGGEDRAIRVSKLYPEMEAIGDPSVPKGKNASSYANNACRGLERRKLVVMERSQSGRMTVVKARLTGKGATVAKKTCRQLGVEPQVGEPLMANQSLGSNDNAGGDAEASP